MNEKIEVLISEEEIQKRVNELANTIQADYAGEEITIICVLKGAVMFATDLLKKVNGNIKLEFIKASSYEESTKSSGESILKYNTLDSAKDKNILIVEDIIDTGITLSHLKEYYLSQSPKSFKICALLSKPERREVDINVDYIGFSIPNEFAVGYGLDYAQKYRNLPYVAILKFDEKITIKE